MSTQLPAPLAELVSQLSLLPGLGPKSALRMAMTLLEWPESQTRRLGESIVSLRDSLCICSSCGALAAADPCHICADPARQTDLLCIVPELDSLMALEKGGFFHGKYLVLGGLLEPLQNQNSRQLAIDNLVARLSKGEVKELVLALGTTIEAENTVSYLKQIVQKRFPDLKISRLAQGIPLGAQIKFMDKETLRQSMLFRQDLK